VYFFIVDLDKTAANEVCLRSIIFCYRYYLTKGSWNYTSRLFAFVSAHHCMGLSTAGLSICEDGSIISIKNILDKRKSALLIDIALRRFWSKNAIKWKAFWLLFSILPYKIDLIVLWIYFYYVYAGYVNSKYTSLFLFGVHWANSHHDFNSFCHLAPC
jgi:hypothetical protein